MTQEAKDRLSSVPVTEREFYLKLKITVPTRPDGSLEIKHQNKLSRAKTPTREHAWMVSVTNSAGGE